MTSPVFVQVAVNVPSVTGVFDYSVPGGLQSQAGVGKLVIVPFGNLSVQAVILRFVAQPAVPAVKDLREIVDPMPVLNDVQIAVAEQIAVQTRAPLAALVGLFIPTGLDRHADQQYSVVEGSEQAKDVGARELTAGSTKTRLLKLLRERGAMRGRQIDRHFRNVAWRKAASQLVHGGWLDSHPVLPPASVRPKFVRTAELAVSPQAAEAALPTLGRSTATQARRARALRILLERPGPVNVAWLYAGSGCKSADLQELAERELILLCETEIWRDPLARAQGAVLPAPPALTLTTEQQAAWQHIQAGFGEQSAGKAVHPFLLHGITGSGKTELYLLAAGEAVRRGKQAIILVPEIALTPQISQRFLQRFPGQVGLVHSRLSDGERYDTWRRARAGRLSVVIGPRSGLFIPLPALGLIVLDECHDPSYYQSEPPFYHAATVAQLYARLAGAVLLLGSATPTVVQRYQAEISGTPRLQLSRRAGADRGAPGGTGLPPVAVVDMRDELKAGNRGVFSRLLLSRLESTLDRGEQAILFLNRRGTATYVFCRSCGLAVKCPRCDTPMTLHTGEGALMLCHHCGYRRRSPQSCSACGSTSVGMYGLGSEKVEADLQRHFPGARTLRWDWDTTRERDAHEVILAHFAAGRADVLIGTQMIAKGLDIPRVTLVGMVLADVGLNLPDPFAVERVFQTLTHAAGRAGRGEADGNVVLQTFLPEHYAIQAVAAHDVDGFYQQEAKQRRRLGYPPFSRLLRLEYRHPDAARAEQQAHHVARAIEALGAAKDLLDSRQANELRRAAPRETTLIGPAPCFYRKLNGQYRWQIVLRGPNPADRLPAQLADGWRIEVDPISLL